LPVATPSDAISCFAELPDEDDPTPESVNRIIHRVFGYKGGDDRIEEMKRHLRVGKVGTECFLKWGVAVSEKNQDVEGMVIAKLDQLSEAAAMLARSVFIIKKQNHITFLSW